MEQLFRAGAVGAVLTLGLPATLASAWAQTPAGTTAAAPAPNAPAPATAASTNPQENLTVLGHRKKFETAPMPGPALLPPPDKPDVHLGRYKVSGDQSTPDGHDAQTGAYIAPFGTAYTGASPVAGGLSSHFEH